MGLLKDIIEGRERIGNGGKIVSRKPITRVWTTNPKLIEYLQENTLDNDDVGYFTKQVISYFRTELRLKLSVIEGVFVRKIVEDTITRFKFCFHDIPSETPPLTTLEIQELIYKKYIVSGIILPGGITYEVVQRMMFEVFGLPIEIMREFGDRIPQYEIDYLHRLHYRINHPFSSDEYYDKAVG